MKVAIIIVAALSSVVLLAWLGLQVKPGPFAAFPHAQDVRQRAPIELPAGLPAPVERFYRQVYGGSLPLVDSAVISGRARMRIAGITFPARFRFTHDAGRGYRHYIEATIFGLPVMRVNETYLDGRARLQLPFGITENEPKVDQAANLGLWAESIWLPPVFISDPRVSWEGVDELTALLTVPFGDQAQRFVVRFDENTGLPRFFESMRFKESNSDRKSLWLNEVREWGEVGGRTVPTSAAVTWYEDGSPWAVLEVEEVVYNAEVEEYMRATGP